jgi:hypothetical protein
MCPGHIEYLFFTREITRRLTALPLDLTNVYDHGLTLRNEFEKLPVQRRKLVPEFFEIHDE